MASKRKQVDDNDVDCPICLDDVLAPPVIVTPCGHMFCGSCILAQAETAQGPVPKFVCPVCRTPANGYVVPPHLRTEVLATADDEHIAKDLHFTERAPAVLHRIFSAPAPTTPTTKIMRDVEAAVAKIPRVRVQWNNGGVIALRVHVRFNGLTDAALRMLRIVLDDQHGIRMKRIIGDDMYALSFASDEARERFFPQH